ncbi:hypothetical protein M413DRAFT_448261 [Hebeloma cylindrosporum]|uniref:F-box domain-containing protein n=1 Tax=Hebeloma cylindrosporum TaxID=76867 RepID=A0A0C2XIV6_HEBCY|nr:hypothetical protein M413DRAFT_448261 [Hebeloma cylindrosporum h7]
MTLLDLPAEILYRIELEKAGMIDNPYCPLSTQMKLEMLCERERAWSTFDWKFIHAKKVPSTASPAYGLSAEELSLGIEGGPNEFESTGIQYLKLPSIIGGQVTSSQWRCLDFGEQVLDFGSATEEHDLLVRSRILPPANGNPLPIILIDFRHDSDPTKPHKSANIPAIPLQYATERQGAPVLSIEIAGENMAALVSFPDDAADVSCLYVFNWKLGIEKTVDPLAACCEKVVFVKEDLLLIPDSSRCALHLYKVPPSTSSTPYIRLVQTLNLPTLKDSAVLTDFYSYSGPDATHRSAFPPHFPNNRPFMGDPESAIITFSFAVSSNGNDEDTEFFAMVMHKKSLVNLVSLNTSNDGADNPPLSWESWGPPITRWFIVRETATEFSLNSWGQRYVQHSLSAVVNPKTIHVPCTITIYDFNPWRVRYIRRHQDQILAPVPKHPKLTEIKVSREGMISNPPITHLGELEDVCVTDKFTSNIVGKLPCVAYSSMNWPEYDGLFIDDERLIGIYTEEDTFRINELDVIYFG